MHIICQQSVSSIIHGWISVVHKSQVVFFLLSGVNVYHSTKITIYKDYMVLPVYCFLSRWTPVNTNLLAL